MAGHPARAIMRTWPITPWQAHITQEQCNMSSPAGDRDSSPTNAKATHRPTNKFETSVKVW